MLRTARLVTMTAWAVAFLAACSDDSAWTCDDPDGGDCTEIDAGPPNFDPWAIMTSSELENPRGWLTQRGIIHCHSPYSHDACDGDPFPEGQRNEQCFEDVRFGMCDTRQDFVFMTDHDDYYAHYEYPEVLLYKDGDELIFRDNLPVANRVNCPDGWQVIMAAGTESAMMPIGIEHHLGDTLEERIEAYNTIDATAIRAFQDAGALVYLHHTEEWEVQQILDLPIDGIEIYTLHYNTIDNLGDVALLMLRYLEEPEMMPEPEIAFIAIMQENEHDLYRWSMAVMQKPMPGALATDVHQNSLDDPAPDGERVDSFRRMMRWFSNYVLVPDGPVDDLVLKEAIGQGRMYGAFDYLGYPIGFDFYGASGQDIYEMGDFVPAGAQPELRVTLPTVYSPYELKPDPPLTVRILKADSGDWIEVASGSTDLTHTAEDGVYRAEVRMLPEHLRPWLGPEADDYIMEMIWIYSNPIYVGAPAP